MKSASAHSLAQRHESEGKFTTPPDRTGAAYCRGFQNLRRAADVQRHAHHGVDRSGTTGTGFDMGRDRTGVGWPRDRRGHCRSNRHLGPGGEARAFPRISCWCSTKICPPASVSCCVSGESASASLAWTWHHVERMTRTWSLSCTAWRVRPSSAWTAISIVRIGRTLVTVWCGWTCQMITRLSLSVDFFGIHRSTRKPNGWAWSHGFIPGACCAGGSSNVLRIHCCGPSNERVETAGRESGASPDRQP
jgi:hypothetical protein